MSKKGSFPDLKADAVKCSNFLSEFISNYAEQTKPYIEQLQAIADRRSNVLHIRVDDLRQVTCRHTRAGEGDDNRQGSGVNRRLTVGLVVCGL